MQEAYGFSLRLFFCRDSPMTSHLLLLLLSPTPVRQEGGKEHNAAIRVINSADADTCACITQFIYFHTASERTKSFRFSWAISRQWNKTKLRQLKGRSTLLTNNFVGKMPYKAFTWPITLSMTFFLIYNFTLGYLKRYSYIGFTLKGKHMHKQNCASFFSFFLF